MSESRPFFRSFRLGDATGIDPSTPITVEFTHSMMAGMEEYADVHEGHDGRPPRTRELELERDSYEDDLHPRCPPEIPDPVCDPHRRRDAGSERAPYQL